MAVKLANLKKIALSDPPFIFIYSLPGLGKTSLAHEFPNAVFIQPEFSAVEGIELTSWGKIKSLAEINDAIDELYNEDHSFKTVVLDTIDATQPLLWKAVCEKNNWPDIEAPGFGKGYTAADDEWRNLLSGLNALRTDRRMNVVMIGHAEIERFDDPQTTSYSKYDFRAHKRAHGIIEDFVDAILFINQDPTIKIEKQGFGKERARAEGGDTRWIHCVRRPVWNAKNRFGMPAQILFEKGKGYSAMSKYFPEQNLLNPGRVKQAAA